MDSYTFTSNFLKKKYIILFVNPKWGDVSIMERPFYQILNTL